jgi:hypothetical protein
LLRGSLCAGAARALDPAQQTHCGGSRPGAPGVSLATNTVQPVAISRWGHSHASGVVHQLGISKRGALPIRFVAYRRVDERAR